jgi:hypothetical protein
MRIPSLHIEIASDNLTFKGGDVIEGFVHCDFSTLPQIYHSNTLLTLDFSGTESTKWEVPDN